MQTDLLGLKFVHMKNSVLQLYLVIFTVYMDLFNKLLNSIFINRPSVFVEQLLQIVVLRHHLSVNMDFTLFWIRIHSKRMNNLDTTY
jgi:hypothetical protein